MSPITMLVTMARWPSGGLLIPLPLLGLRLGSPTVDTFDGESPPGAATEAITASGLTPSVLRPTQVLAASEAAPDAAQRLSEVDGVAAATRMDSPDWSAGGTELIEVFFTADPATTAGSQTLERVRAIAPSLDARVGGSPAEDADFGTAVYGDAPWSPRPSS